MTFNRNRFQAAKLEVNKQVTDEVEKTFKFSSSRGDYHVIEEGKNYFRMMPPHNPDEPSMQAKVVYWLECKVEEEKNGEATGKFVIKDRPLFDSRIHGGTPKDIINEYINFTKNVIFQTVQDKDEKSKLLAPIHGWRDKSGKWNSGILANHSFVCYATKGDVVPANIGRLELWKRDKEMLEKLNISEASDEPIMTDVFSDPDKGVQFIIDKSRDAKGELFTLIKKNTFTPKAGNYSEAHFKEFLDSQRVSDEVLEKLAEMEPLSKQFKKTYKRTDFERAVEALEMFDQKHGFGTFENEEFLEVVREVDTYYPENGEENSVEEKPSIQTPEALDINAMTREELKEYIKENNLSIKVLPSMTIDVIRDLIYDAESSPEEPFNEPEKEEPKQAEPTPEPEPATVEPPTESLKERIARLKGEKK